MKRLVIGSLLLAALYSCKKPEACFTASSTNVKVGEPITFSDCSKNGANYLWDFGNGETSTEARPVFAFETFGTYTVSLTVSNKKEKRSHSTTSGVTVDIPTVAELSGTWFRYKEETETGSIVNISPEEKWEFLDNDTLLIDNTDYPYVLDSDGTFQITNWRLSTYEIVKLFGNDLVIRENEVSLFGGPYIDHYLRR